MGNFCILLMQPNFQDKLFIHISRDCLKLVQLFILVLLYTIILSCFTLMHALLKVVSSNHNTYFDLNLLYKKEFQL